MSMSPGRSSAGRAPKQQVRIVKVESLDSDGNSLNPVKYEFWVVNNGHPPTVQHVCNSFQEAYMWTQNNECQLNPH